MVQSNLDAVPTNDAMVGEQRKEWATPAVIVSEAKNAESGASSFASDFVYNGNQYSS